MSSRTALILPTLNAGPAFVDWLAALRGQSVLPHRLILVDSASTDDTVRLASDFGFEVNSIRREEFSHGGTRQMCVEQLENSDILIFLTQDAVLATPDALGNLLAWFDDPGVAAVYGRQLPRRGAGPIEAHARLFNYPDEDLVKTEADIPRLGIKTAFISNSFAAYRRSSLMRIGGFPTDTIVSEDTYTASKLILAGRKVVYASKAAVYHSHRMTYRQEIQRYFDIGVFHAREPWIRQRFGQAGGEGSRFVRSELRYVLTHKPSAIPSVLFRSGLKLAGYKLGHIEATLPVWLKKRLSGSKGYWKRRAGTV
ncbi:MAG: glycosyltransferase family 2 protein [Candidatus Zixiibacteriota bacterium]|nr:MAG: glycosyltransferase family 2 protein [candidate division Zixibacteria bacterium]